MDNRLKCQICKKTFTQKSSLVRHSKRCMPGPAPSLRQKSCRQCTSSKTKCDLRRPKCSRCEQRDTICEYIIPMTRGTRSHSPVADGIDVGSNEHYVGNNTLSSMADIASMSFHEAPHALLSDMNLDLNAPVAPFGFTNAAETTTEVLDILAEKDPFAGLQWPQPMSSDVMALMLPVPTTQSEQDPALISCGTTPDTNDFSSEDWLLWNPGPSQITSPLAKHSMETLLRVIKTWPKMLAKGFQTPPMLHFTHTSPNLRLQPMANCITIANMWANQGVGESENVRQAIIQEMRSIFEQYRSMDERHLLSALQALVMYTIIIMFLGKEQVSVSLLDPAIFLCLQKFVSYIAKTGLMLTEERDNERPSWESWVHVTAKRRAVFSLYLLHWSYSIYHNLPSFACSQLGFMPAPAPKFLWQAETKEKWEGLYDRWLAQWGDCPYMMREFAAVPAGAFLERRTEIWLEDADELGVLFFSIVNATDRENTVYSYGNGIPVLTEES